MKKVVVDIGNTLGMEREFDELGRIVIPKEFRRKLGIKHGDVVQIYLTKEGVYIKVKGE